MYEADVLVVALGADYDIAATPGLAEARTSSTRWPARRGCATCSPAFSRGHALIGVCGAPYKCPPAPSECALMLHDYLVERGVRDACEITLVDAASDARCRPRPKPPRRCSPRSPSATSRSSRAARIARARRRRSVAMLDDGSELPFDLFLGVPKHRAPDVVVASGMTEDGWVPVDSATLETRFPGVYAIGDVATPARRRPASSPRAPRASSRRALIAGCAGGEQPAPLRRARAPATSSSARTASAASTSTSSPARSRPARSRRRPPRCAPRRTQFGASRRARWFGRG